MDGAVTDQALPGASPAAVDLLGASAASPAKAQRLPPLRDELRLLPTSANADGSPAWLIQDPVTNRFYRIGWVDFELLLRWDQANMAQILDSIAQETPLTVDAQDVMDLLKFLDAHQLLQARSPDAVERLHQRAQARRQSPQEWLLHNYLFFRVPLLRPQEALARWLPRVAWLFTRGTAMAVLALTALGLFLVSRQWDAFTHAVVDQLSWSGLVGFAVALAIAKALHELGHAFTASRYGVRVAHMGVAFLVLFPMLYTDTSESWRLSQPRQRLAIASAGIVTELALAGLSTLAWALAPEGWLKNGLLYLATTSWLLTLALNASPFMRFDGYFILSDLLDLPNLHERAGAQARTWLRRRLLGLPEEWPEPFAPRVRLALIAFAITTWVYRLLVFLAIALLVYVFFFKLLGLLLMLVEVVWFIGRPVAAELRVWFARRRDVARPQRWGWLAAGVVVGLALLVPWHGAIDGSGWLHPQMHQTLHAPLPGRVVALPAAAGPVRRGQVLIDLESPEARLSAQRAQALAQAREQELLGLGGLPNGEDRRAIVTSQRDQFEAEQRLYTTQQARLQIVAPFDGMLVDVDPQLAPGVWVQPSLAIGAVVDPRHWVVDAYVPEADLRRVKVGQAARVHGLHKSLTVLRGRVTEIDTARTGVLPHRVLDATGGGPIATLSPATAAPSSGRSDGVPRDALFRVRIALAEPPPQLQMASVRVVIEGEPRALLPAAAERVVSVLVRESGF